MLDNACRLLVQALSCAHAAETVFVSFEIVLDDPSTRLRAALRAGPGEPFPAFYPLDGAARS